MFSVLIAVMVAANAVESDSPVASTVASANTTMSSARHPGWPYEWQVGIGGGIPQMGGVMVRWWLDERNAVEFRGHGAAHRETRPDPLEGSKYWSDSGTTASGEFAADLKYIHAIFQLDGRNRLSSFASPTWLRGLAYAGAGAYAFYEDRVLRRKAYGHYKIDPSTGREAMEIVYADDVVHIEDRRLSAVGGAGVEIGLGRISANALFGYAVGFDSEFEQYELGPSFDVGVAFGF